MHFAYFQGLFFTSRSYILTKNGAHIAFINC